MFTIAQISDTHLSDDKPFFVGNFVRVGEALRANRPDLVLHSGDITLDGASNEADLAAARLLHGGLGLPVRFLRGNHDLGDSQDSPGHGGLGMRHRLSVEGWCHPERSEGSLTTPARGWRAGCRAACGCGPAPPVGAW
jgi:predicted phosphodiesterase